MKVGIGTFPRYVHRPLLHKNSLRTNQEKGSSGIHQLGKLINDAPRSSLAWVCIDQRMTIVTLCTLSGPFSSPSLASLHAKQRAGHATSDSHSANN